jgi:hypothetical protein
MKPSPKLGLFAAIAALAVTAPAAARPGGHPTHPDKPSHPSQSHKCMAHKVAYIAKGTLVSWSATKNSDGTYSGAITVHVRNVNHHARSDKGTDVTYTLDHAKVTLGHGVMNPPTAGDEVKVIGKITTLAKKCDHTGFTPTITVRRVVVHAPTKK